MIFYRSNFKTFVALVFITQVFYSAYAPYNVKISSSKRHEKQTRRIVKRELECIHDLSDAGYIYSRGTDNFKYKNLGMTQIYAESISLPSEQVAIANLYEQKLFYTYYIDKGVGVQSLKLDAQSVSKYNIHSHGINFVEDYYRYLSYYADVAAKTVKTATTYCRIKSCSLNLARVNNKSIEYMKTDETHVDENKDNITGTPQKPFTGDQKEEIHHAENKEEQTNIEENSAKLEEQVLDALSYEERFFLLVVMKLNNIDQYDALCSIRICMGELQELKLNNINPLNNIKILKSSKKYTSNLLKLTEYEADYVTHLSSEPTDKNIFWQPLNGRSWCVVQVLLDDLIKSGLIYSTTDDIIKNLELLEMKRVINLDGSYRQYLNTFKTMYSEKLYTPYYYASKKVCLAELNTFKLSQKTGKENLKNVVPNIDRKKANNFQFTPKYIHHLKNPKDSLLNVKHYQPDGKYLLTPNEFCSFYAAGGA